MEDRLTSFERSFVGQSCAVARREADWCFTFGDAGFLGVQCPWRLVAENRITVAGSDDQQMFGLGAPLDVEARANALLEGRAVSSLTVDSATADLRVQFEGGLLLELLNDSCGYEGWYAGMREVDAGRVSVSGLGGGGVHFD